MEHREKKTCEPCHSDAPPVARVELIQFHKEHPDWVEVEEGGVKKVRRRYSFKDYPACMGFTRQVAEMADFEDHHPVIVLEWGAVTVTWWTHKIGGLHRNDLLMARETDLLAGQ